MKEFAKLMTIAGIFVVFATCASADTIWNLNNVQFNCSSCATNLKTNTVTGFFTVNTALNGLVNWDITVAGSNTQANAHYTPAGPGVAGITGEASLDPTLTYLYFYFHQVNQISTYDTYLNLDLASVLTSTGGTINLVPGNGDISPWHASLACPGCGTLESGSITTDAIGGTTTPVPEPSTLILLGLGLSGVGFTTWRRKK